MPFTSLIFRGTHPHVGLPPLLFEPAQACFLFSVATTPKTNLRYSNLVVVCFPRKLVTHEAAKRCAKKFAE
jgi:hypothetical protein